MKTSTISRYHRLATKERAAFSPWQLQQGLVEQLESGQGGWKSPGSNWDPDRPAATAAGRRVETGGRKGAAVWRKLEPFGWDVASHRSGLI